MQTHLSYWDDDVDEDRDDDDGPTRTNPVRKYGHAMP